MSPKLCSGQLVKWKDKQGFGFIRSADGTKEIFLHISALKDSIRRPQVGDTIYYRSINEDGKVRACQAFILGARDKSRRFSSSQSVSCTLPRAAFPVLETLILSAVPLVGAIHFYVKLNNPLPLVLYPIMSFLTFSLYADDKSRARKEKWRISERTLHLCELAGGWLGGFIAQRKLRHKSRKETYQAVFWGIVVVHHIFWLGWLFLNEMFMG